MASYFISGIYNDTGKEISGYFIHSVNSDGSVNVGKKYSIAEGVAILDGTKNTMQVRMWDYDTAWWKLGDMVKVVNGHNKKYLRSHRDDKENDNLEHLIRVYAITG